MQAVTSPFDPLWLRVADPLRQRIVDGELAPGAPLSENRLAADYAVSRTPVREALRLLMEEGLVEMLPGRKVRVALPDAHDVREVYDVRRVLESEALRRVFAQPQSIAPLAAALEASCDDGDRALAARDLRALALANERFHAALVEALGNRRLLSQYRLVHNLIRLYRNQTLRSEQWAEAGTAEHRELVRRIRDRDETGALALLEAHMQRAQQVLREQHERLNAAQDDRAEPNARRDHQHTP